MSLFTTNNENVNNRYEVEWCNSSTAVIVFLNNHPNIEIVSITCSKDNYNEHFYVFYKKKNRDNKKDKPNKQ